MQNKSILLVDDEQIILDSLSRDLQQEGFTVSTAANGLEAINRIRKASFDFVITDLVMPEADGFQVVKEAKKRYPHMSVIILTGYGDMISAVDALRLGADDFLQKPCDSEELLFRMTNCLERQELRKKVTLYESILPICSYCKRIRDDRGKEPGQGEWVRIEEYFHKTQDISFSHGCCKECFDKAMKGMGDGSTPDK